jgi:hypothetical protein
MNLGSWPGSVAYDPASGAEPLELDAVLSGSGREWRVALLVAGPQARAIGWAARAAVALAARWSAGPRRVVLADAVFEAPSLHDELGVANGEGLSDVFLFGASLAHVRLRGESPFDLIPAGAWAPDPAALRSDPGWSTLVHTGLEDDATLLIYGPAEGAGLDHLVELAPDCIVLLAGDDGVALELPPAARPAIVLRPATEASAAAPAPPAWEDEEEPGAARRPERDPEDQPGSAPAAAPLDIELQWPDDPFGGEPVFRGLHEPLLPEEPAYGGTPAGTEPAPEPEPGPEPGPKERLPRLPDENFARLRVPRDAERESLIADLRARQRQALMVPPPDASAPAERRRAATPTEPQWEPEREGPVSPPSPPHRHRAAPTEPDFPLRSPARAAQRRHNPLLLTLLVVLGLSLLAGVWHLLGTTWDAWRAQRAAPPPAAAPAEGTTGAISGGETGLVGSLDWAVAMQAYLDVQTAEQRVDYLRTAEPERSFYIVPLLQAGDVYYRVMAGPVSDSGEAAVLMQELLEAEHIMTASALDIRSEPLTFLIGEFPDRTAAESRRRELRGRVPSYVIEMPLVVPENRTAHWRLYAGAYRGAAEADVMRRMLQAAGQPDSLVRRMGRITP